MTIGLSVPWLKRRARERVRERIRLPDAKLDAFGEFLRFDHFPFFRPVLHWILTLDHIGPARHRINATRESVQVSQSHSLCPKNLPVLITDLSVALRVGFIGITRVLLSVSVMLRSE